MLKCPKLSLLPSFMSRNKSFYITTTLPYVNAEAHLGHAMEFVRADIIARFQRLLGREVFFNTGTDEHGLKIYRKAKEEGKDAQQYVDEYAEKFKDILKLLNISYDRFIRTTDESHKIAAQDFWSKCLDAGYIDKRFYKVKYCVGCELEKTESELEHGKCPLHLNLELEVIDEDNYFFKFSAFKDQLLKYYNDNPNFVIPESRFKEIKRFIERGPEDFSISRLKEKMPWGVPVPNDPNQVMYVWFDALVSYISALGWPNDTEKFKKFWVNGETVQYAGKDNLRQQSAMWQAMLMSIGLPNTNQVVINGFILGEGGVKMSKSLGNVINPVELLDEYGTDSFRYFVARGISTFEDSEFTRERFKEVYNANLANGLGNLVSRIMKLAETYLSQSITIKSLVFDKELESFLDKFEIQKAMNYIWKEIGDLDALIQDKKPWESKDREVITDLVFRLAKIASSLAPFMPETSAKILLAIKENKMPISLFLRKN